MPQFTSCCPAWVKYAEIYHPEILPNLSTAKSPIGMQGPTIKTYLAKHVWAEKMGIDKKDLVCVSIMPCISKKYEASREEFTVEENPDVDYSLTTRELGRILKQYNIDFNSLQESEFDSPMGKSTGAADIFGRTGGVMEAASRTLYEWATGTKLEDVDFVPMRGFEEVRVAEVKVGNEVLRLAVVHGLGAARKVVEKIKAGEENFHAVEVMACIRPDVFVLNNNGPIVDRLIDLGKNDVVVAISFNRYSGNTKFAVQIARDAGAKIISFTDFYTSPIAQGVDKVIINSVENFSFYNSYASSMMNIETIVALVSKKNIAANKKRLMKMETYLEQNGEY